MKRKRLPDCTMTDSSEALRDAALQSLPADTEPYHFTDDEAAWSSLKESKTKGLRSQRVTGSSELADECDQPLSKRGKKERCRPAKASSLAEGATADRCTASTGHEMYECEPVSPSLAAGRRREKLKLARRSMAAEGEMSTSVEQQRTPGRRSSAAGGRSCSIATERHHRRMREADSDRGEAKDDAVSSSSDAEADRSSDDVRAAVEQKAARAKRRDKPERKNRKARQSHSFDDDDTAVLGTGPAEHGGPATLASSSELDLASATDEYDDDDDMTAEERLIDSIMNVHMSYNGVAKKHSPYDRDTAIHLLAKHGVQLATGRWSPLETARLCQNFHRYCRHHPEVDVRAMLNGTQHLPPKLRKQLWQQAVKTQLYRRLAHGIRRPQYLVYFKARRMFHNACRGSYSAEEKQQLLRLVEQYGRNWLVIGDILNRNRMSCHGTYHRMRKQPHVTGVFTAEEDEQLSHAVQECADKYGVAEPYKRLPWTEVAAIVGNRTAAQCSYRWLNHLCYMHRHGELRRPFGRKEQLHLLELVCSAGVTEECFLDWHELLQHFDNVGSPQQLRLLWFKHLKSKVPRYWLLTFEDICDYLYTSYEPVLRSQVHAAEHRSSASASKTPAAVTSS